MKGSKHGVLAGVPSDLPELTRAVEFQQRAADVGFDWNQLPPVLAKIREELAELETEMNGNGPRERKLDELGDVLFAVANLARKLELDPEQALRSTNRKFQRRFDSVQAELANQGKQPQQATLEEMDALWELAKHDEP